MIDREIRHMYAVEEEHWWFRAKDDLIRQLVRIHVAPRKGMRVLDIGCGTGRLLACLEKDLAGFTPELYGIDQSETAVELARSRTGARLECAELNPSSDMPDSLSLITAADILEHLEDDRGMLSRLCHVLGAGGHVILTVPAFRLLWSSHDEALSHKRRYTRTQLVRLLEECGFNVVRSGYFFSYVFPLFVISRMTDIIVQRSRLSRRKEHSATQKLPRFINRLLGRVCSFERRFPVPFWGSTVYCVARKNGL